MLIVKEIKKLIITIAQIKIINIFLKAIVLPLVRLNLISSNTALNIPAVGSVPVKLKDGSTFVLSNNGQDRVANALFWLGIEGYEFESTRVWAQHASEAKIILDIGAYSGIYSLIAASVNAQAKIFAFEPFPESYQTLCKNVEINNFSQIKPVNQIVCNKTGREELNIPHYATLPQSPTIISEFNAAQKNHTQTIECTTIDDFVKANNLSQVDLVKIDVESAEPLVLDGMKETIKQFSPIMFIEVLFGKTEHLLNNYFKDLDYHYYLLTDNGPIKKDIIEGDPEGRFFNYLFTKKELS